ncbi:hypothetical protein KBD75_00225 [Candidatus Woesebacteria bacterium]|nr:hypothetical protein [Candidatus Woesebacteria bacterium]
MIRERIVNDELDTALLRSLSEGKVIIQFDFVPNGLTRAYVHISFGSFILSGFRVMAKLNQPYSKGEEVVLAPPSIPNSNSTKLMLVHFANIRIWNLLQTKVINQYSKEVPANISKFAEYNNFGLPRL